MEMFDNISRQEMILPSLLFLATLQLPGSESRGSEGGLDWIREDRERPEFVGKIEILK